MKMSQLFGRTLRDQPSEADLISHVLLLQAGMIHQVSTGVYSYLPLAWKSIKKIEAIIREEMDLAGAQEVKLGILQNREIWKQSGRDEIYGPDMLRLKDRRERELSLPPTNEELITETVKTVVQSYNDLPFILYQIQTKFRDEPRPRGGLIRVREFDMMDAYSFDADEDGLDLNYQKMISAYTKSFERCGINTVIVDADSGAIGGKDSKEFILLADSGEDTIIMCPKCDYAANDEKASFEILRDRPEPAQTLESIHTPNQTSIEDVSHFLNISQQKTIKTIAYMSDDEIILVSIRGDLEINEVKLKNFLKAKELSIADDEQLKKYNLIKGFLSPINKDFKTIIDHSITPETNYCAGGNEYGYHHINVMLGRDIIPDSQLDIALAKEGFKCIKCPSNLVSKRGIEIGHVFKLGTTYSTSMNANFLNHDGNPAPIIMGCYGIGVGRILAGSIEQHADEKGIVFPKNIAPYQAIVVSLNTDKKEIKEAALKIYDHLNSNGIETIIDDRNTSAGVKFNDADLLGVPIRIVVSSRNISKDSVEIKIRTANEGELIHLDTVLQKTSQLLSEYK